MELHERSVDKFSCHECGKLFLKKYLLEHERWHTTDMPYACHLCPAEFRRKYYMEVHVLGHKGEKPHKCVVCEQSFTQLYSRKQHMHRVHRDAKLKVTANIDIMEEPRSPTTTMLPDVTCRDIKEKAGMRSSPPPLLSLVMESVNIKMEPSSPATTPPPDMSCGDIKEETTPDSPTPSSHPLDVARTPQTSSTETSEGSAFADSEQGIPSGTSRAPVETCGSGAGSSSHVCDVCGRALSSKASLKRHHLSHTGERPYACSVCDRRFAQKSHLHAHEHTHAKDESRACKLCPFKASSRLMLARHCGLHKYGLKMHQCLQCGKLLMSSTALEEHQKRHNSKRKLYSCHVCPSSFTVKSQLDNHVLIHAQDNQKPHACPICKKCFSWWSSLITHMGQEHHGVESSVAGAGNSA